jgi:hypothetical protein
MPFVFRDFLWSVVSSLRTCPAPFVNIGSDWAGVDALIAIMDHSGINFMAAAGSDRQHHQGWCSVPGRVLKVVDSNGV